MPKVELNQVRGLSRVVHLNDWLIKFVTVPEGAGIQSFADELDIRAISVDFPRATVIPQQIDIRGHRYFVPTDTEFEPTLNIQLIETDNTRVLSAMLKWREFAYETLTGYKAPPDEIKADLKIFLLNRQLQPIYEYTVYGAWPTSFDPGGQLVGDKGADIMRPTLTLQYDYFLSLPICAGETGGKPPQVPDCGG